MKYYLKIRRKSHDFEHNLDNPLSVNTLKTNEIFEENSFDHLLTDDDIVTNEDIDEEDHRGTSIEDSRKTNKKITTDNLYKFDENCEKLHVNVIANHKATQAATYQQQQNIDYSESASIGTNELCKQFRDEQHATSSFTIVPINVAQNSTVNNYGGTTELSEIILTSFDAKISMMKKIPFTLAPTSPPPPPPPPKDEGCKTKSIHQEHHVTESIIHISPTISTEVVKRFVHGANVQNLTDRIQEEQTVEERSVNVAEMAENNIVISNAEIHSQPCSSTSPESLMDNVLSAASSVSIRSSSLSSSGAVGFDSASITNGGDIIAIDQMGYGCDGRGACAVIPSNAACDNHIRATEHKAAGIGKVNAVFVGNDIRHETINVITKKNHTNRTFNLKSMELRSIASDNSTINVSPTLVKSHLNDTQQTLQSTEHNAISSRRSRSSSPIPSITVRTNAARASTVPEELQCRICAEPFRDPRTLNCLHSFCFQCLVDENFKQDASIQFWSQATINQHDSVKASDKTNSTTRSPSPETPIRRGSSEVPLLPLRQRKTSFNIRPKKSAEKTTTKDGKSSDSSSSSTSRHTNFADERIISCKICNFPTELPIGGLRQLPQNFVLTRKANEYQLKTFAEDALAGVCCSLCYEETNATYHCVTCALNLCSLCKDSHERQRTTAKHKIENILEFRRLRKQKENILRDNTNITLKCGMHPEFEMKSFCSTCLQIACADCLILFHKGHKHDPIHKAFVCYSKILHESTEQIRPLCNYGEHSIERLNEIARGINRKCDQIQTEVETFMNQYFEALEVHRKTLLQQVQRARQSKVDMILEQQLHLEKRNSEAVEAVRFSQELLQSASDVEILSYIKILLKRFEYCQKFKIPAEPKISHTLHFLPEIRAPSTKTQNNIPLFGIITMQTVEPSLCTLQLEGFSHLRLHKKIELILQSRDADGITLCHGGLKPNAKLKYKEPNSKFLPVEISDFRDGTYGIAFTPDSQGTIILAVTINDKHIKGSPFIFRAVHVRPHNGIYHCCTFCSSKGNKLVKCACDCRMPGYNGCGHGHAGHPGHRHWSCCGNVLENSECNVANKLLNS